MRLHQISAAEGKTSKTTALSAVTTRINSEALSHTLQVSTVDRMLDEDVAALMAIVPQDSEDAPITGGAFDDVKV